MKGSSSHKRQVLHWCSGSCPSPLRILPSKWCSLVWFGFVFCISVLHSLLDYYHPLVLIFPGLRKPSFGLTNPYLPIATVLVPLVFIPHCLHNPHRLGFHYYQSAKTILSRSPVIFMLCKPMVNSLTLSNFLSQKHAFLKWFSTTSQFHGFLFLTSLIPVFFNVYIVFSFCAWHLNTWVSEFGAQALYTSGSKTSPLGYLI